MDYLHQEMPDEVFLAPVCGPRKTSTPELLSNVKNYVLYVNGTTTPFCSWSRRPTWHKFATVDMLTRSSSAPSPGRLKPYVLFLVCGAPSTNVHTTASARMRMASGSWSRSLQLCSPPRWLWQQQCVTWHLPHRLHGRLPARDGRSYVSCPHGAGAGTFAADDEAQPGGVLQRLEPRASCP